VHNLAAELANDPTNLLRYFNDVEVEVVFVLKCRIAELVPFLIANIFVFSQIQRPELIVPIPSRIAKGVSSIVDTRVQQLLLAFIQHSFWCRIDTCWNYRVDL
jgi:hypothetical protein